MNVIPLIPLVPLVPLVPRLRRLFAIASLAAVGLVGACGSLPSSDSGADEHWLKNTDAGNRVESLLHWFDYARRLPTSEWTREHERLRQQWGNDKSDFTRLRLGLLLAAPNAPGREQARAAPFLEPLTRNADGRDPGLRALAQLVAVDLAERRRLAEELQSTAHQLQSTAQQLQSATQQLQATAQRQKDDAMRANDLEQKLEALKTIEKNLQQRKLKVAPNSAAKSQ